MTLHTHVNLECHFIALLSLPATCRGTCIFTPSTLHMYMYTEVTITPDYYQTAYTIPTKLTQACTCTNMEYAVCLHAYLIVSYLSPCPICMCLQRFPPFPPHLFL